MKEWQSDLSMTFQLQNCEETLIFLNIITIMYLQYREFLENLEILAWNHKILEKVRKLMNLR